MHISLISTAVSGLIALWLGIRCGRVRMKEKVMHGDGGNVLLLRRMRAQSNFTEYAPFALAMIIVLDLTGHDGWLLGLTALSFLIGRVLHPLGMDAEGEHWGRMIGTLLTMLTLIVLSGMALVAVYQQFG